MKRLRIFLAYPSNPGGLAEWMRLLRDELKAIGHDVVSWEDFKDPGFMFRPISDAIRSADLVLAETTSQNANVLFEVGFALAGC